MRRFGLIGYPLEHSFSPTYFKNKFVQEKIQDCSYELFPLTSINDLHELLDRNSGIKGLNVTIPYKQSVLSQLNSVTAIPSGLNACNCIRIDDGRLIGFNTDAMGFEKSLVPLLKPHHNKSLIFGNGGSAAMVKYVLKNLGISYKLISRELHDDSSLTYQEISKELLDENTLLINTTPVGMFPKTGEFLPLNYEYLSSHHLCYDLIYNPEMTGFLERSKSAGANIKNGLEMLMIQAEESWKIWNP